MAANTQLGNVDSTNNIKLTFENIVDISNNVTQENIDKLRKCHLHVKADKIALENGHPTRLLLTADRYSADMSNAAIRRCNGLIVCGGKVLVYPQEMLNIRPNIKTVIKNWNRYSQYNIIDGSVISLYYFDNKWRIATTNGYDVNDLKWNNSDITYQTVLMQLFSDNRINLNDLNITLSYTFIIRHPSIHLFKRDPMGLWLIRACNGTSEVPLDSLSRPLRCLMRQQARNRLLSYKQINDICKSALHNYVKNPRGSNINYGFILRIENTNSGQDLGYDTNVLLESNMLKKIRQLIYNLPKGDLRPAKPRQYCILRAYLNYSQRPVFKALFPEYLPTFDQYNKLFVEATNCVMNCMRNRNTRAKLIEFHNEPYELIAFNLLADIERMENVNTFDTTSNYILRDIIMDQKYLDLYYSIIYPINGQTVQTSQQPTAVNPPPGLTSKAA
jgi:hypothetical protein